MNDSMGIQKLTDMFMGNPAPLAQKVQQAQQQAKPGQIMPDLKEALALQEIQDAHNASQNQQAIQAGGPQPTILEKLRQSLGQAQQGQPPQMGQMGQMGQRPPMPQGMPQGMPPQMGLRPPMPQGMPPVHAVHGGSIDQLMSNLGNHYGNGGIVAFKRGDEVESTEPVLSKEEADDILRRMEERLGTRTETPIGEPGLLSRGPERPFAGLGASLSGLGSRVGQALRGKQLGSMNLDTESIPKETPAYSNEGREPAPAPAAGPSPQALALLAAQKQKPPRPPAAPVAEAPVQGTPYSSMDATRRNDFPSDVSNILSQRMNQDPEAMAAARQKRLDEEVGKPDNSAILETIAALKAKREKAQANADPLMDLLGGIASARPGQKWWQSGVAGSEYAANKAAQREAADTAYLEQILGHQQKVSDSERGFKLDRFKLGDTERARIYDEVFTAAKAKGESDDRATRLAQEAVIHREKLRSEEMIAANKDKAHIAAANASRGPNFNDTLKADAIKQYKIDNPKATGLEAIAAVNAALLGTRYTGTDKSYEHEKMVQGVIKDRTSLIDMGLQKSGLKPEEEAKLIDRRKAIEMQVRKEFPAPKGEAAAPAASIQSKVEASGQAYEPNKYEYRIAPDGSVQRKAK